MTNPSQFEKLEKECLTTLKKKRIWSFWENFAFSRLMPIRPHWILTLAAVGINLIICSVLSAFFFTIALYLNLFPIQFNETLGPKMLIVGLILYFGIFFTLWQVGKWKNNRYTEQVESLEVQTNTMLANYFRGVFSTSLTKLSAHPSDTAKVIAKDGYLHFGNGVSVSMTEEKVHIPLVREYGEIKIYPKYGDREGLDFEKNYTLLDDKIPSILFTDSFQVLTTEGNERSGLSYLSPSAQVSLLSLYKDAHFFNKSPLLETGDGHVTLQIEKPDVKGKLETIDLQTTLRPRIVRAFSNAELYAKTLVSSSYQIARRFDTDLRYLRGVSH